MEFIHTDIAGLYIITPAKTADERGVFARTYCKTEFNEIGFNKTFVQFNHSINPEKGTLRGMHFQQPPFAETKLIRCVQGAVYDVALDLRKDSLTFGKWFAAELSEENMYSILIPEGFAHGFQTLRDHSALIYHHTEFYTRGADSGIRYDDPAFYIEWKLPVTRISDKDKNYALLDNNFKGLSI